MKYFPEAYTEEEGGSWVPWERGEVSAEALEQRGETVTIKGEKVHSLAFDSPVAGPGRFGRWDSINGWTKPVGQAEEQGCGWRDMESAPKDGERMLLVVDFEIYGEKPLVLIGHWYRGYWCEDDRGAEPLEFDPIKWMPLPEAE